MKPKPYVFIFFVFNFYSWDYLIHRDFWGRDNLFSSLVFCLAAVLNIVAWVADISKSPRWARGVELALALVFGYWSYVFYLETVLFSDYIGLLLLYGGTLAAVFKK